MLSVRLTRGLRRLGAALGILTAASAPARAEPMLITIDDLPLVAAEYFTVEEQVAMIGTVLDVLDAHGATSIVFANGDKILPHHERLMDEFVRRGHAFGSHTFSHPSLNRIPVEAYEEDILRNDEALAPWMTAPKYFRFPFLETGRTRDVRDRVAAYLAAHQYVVVPVTVDSDDWNFATRYTQAVKAGDQAEAARIVGDYRHFVVRAAAEARNLALEKVGREIRHVLLLHLNHLNSVALDAVLSDLEAEGWTWADVDETLADPVYGLEDEYFGTAGLTWLDRVLR